MQTKKTISCLVISANKGTAENRLMKELFLPAILEAGLTVKNADAAGLVLPITDLVSAITTADVCFVDLTGGDVQTRASMGAAMALKVPLCLVSDEATLTSLGHSDVDGLIRYPNHAFPSDYERLKNEISAKLSQLVTSLGEAAEPETSAVQATPVQAPAANTSAEPLQERPAPFALGKAEDPVKFHEHLALKLIFQHGLDSGMTLKQLAKELNKYGIVQATSIAVRGLKRRKLIERHTSPDGKEGDAVSEVFLLTDSGKEWLANHSESVPIPEMPVARDGIALGLMDHLLAI